MCVKSNKRSCTVKSYYLDTKAKNYFEEIFLYIQKKID